MSRASDYAARGARLIPGGTQLLSKRPDLFAPQRWPSYFKQAQGITIEDLDGRRYRDMGIMGVGACVLGYAHPRVDEAVQRALGLGVASSLNCVEEVELAECLVAMHPWAERVRYCRSGGEAMSMAVRIARCRTKRDVVAFCGYHGCGDWYLAANLGDDAALDGHLMPGLPPAGVPRGLTGTAIPFRYNDLDTLAEVIRQHGDELAAVVMEPQRGEEPEAGFLDGVAELCRRSGAVLIFDEITSAWRQAPGGVHRRLGVDPDIAVFAKAMANGYAMSAIIGRATVLDAAQDTFLSSTNWTERIGPVAALATIAVYEEEHVHEHLARIGQAVMDGWQAAAGRHGLQISVAGPPSLAHFSFDGSAAREQATIFCDRMLDHGFLAFTQCKPSLAHQADDVQDYLQAVDAVFAELAAAAGHEACLLRGPAASRGFQRLVQ